MGWHAAKNSIGKTRKDLDSHGAEALAVARAADRAADDIESLKTKLANLRQHAHELHMALNPTTNTFAPAEGSTLTQSEADAADAALRPELAAILAEAAAIDDELAQAINMATGKTPIPTDAGPPVGPDGLTPTQIASDANQARLEEERRETKAKVDALQRQVDAAAVQAYTSGQSPMSPDQVKALGTELNAAKAHLAELDAVHSALGNAPETYLTVFDPRNGTGKQVLAAIAVGNPDTAKNVSVTVPGIGSTTKDTLGGMVTEARALQHETERQLARAGLPPSVATIAWMGYDPAPNPLNTLSPGDLWATMIDDRAQAGAQSLSSYLEQVRANNPNGHITLFGHSYGSLTSSLALQELNAKGVHPVNDVVFYGTPGLELNNADQLGLGSGHAYVMNGAKDPIPGWIAPFTQLHGWGTDPRLGMLPILSAEAGTDLTGVPRLGVDNHADYARPDNNGQLRMSGYNLAAVLAGLPNNEIKLAPPTQVDLPIGARSK